MKAMHLGVRRALRLIGVSGILFTASSFAETVAPTPTPALEDAAPTKTCPRCKGTGLTKCPAPGCRGGHRDCPGPCLKLSAGRWEPLDMPGYPATDVWQKFSLNDGTWTAFNQTHVGEVVETVKGVPKITGKCKVCDGTAKVDCATCKGTASVNCSQCGGKGVVALTAQAAPAPASLGVVRLKDGRVINGRIVLRRGDVVMIKTDEARTLTLHSDELANP
jgi:hypothetical protein